MATTKTPKKPALVSVTELLSQFTRRTNAVVNTNMLAHAEINMRRYGFETVLNRALPDYRDGCIPVRRKTLWAMYKEKNNSANKRQKAAKPVGNTIANYHPHGDVSVFGAIVSMVNSPEHLLDGEGNWGGPTSNAAAMRYVNVRISKYSDAIFFDRRYLPVIDMVPNFDGTNVEPILLPALLPNLLINGLDAGIGVGVSGCMPPFKKAGVKALVQMCLEGKNIAPKLCYETLEFNYTTGCQIFKDDQDVVDKLANFFKTGRGSALFVPDHSINRTDHILNITGTAPLVNATNILLAFGENKKGRWDFIQAANDRTDKNSGQLLIEVVFKNPESNTQFDAWCHEVINQFANQVNYQINVVETFVNDKGEGDARFRRFTLVELVTEWCKWRVELELRALRHELGELHTDLRQSELKLAIAQNVNAYVKAIRQEDDIAAVMKLLACSQDEAEWLLDRPIRTLTRASESKIVEHLQQLATDIAAVQADIAAPTERVLRDLPAL